MYSDAEYERAVWEVVEDVNLICCPTSKTAHLAFVKKKKLNYTYSTANMSKYKSLRELLKGGISYE